MLGRDDGTGSCLVQEADPPVIKDVSRDGQTYARCFLGSEFARFCARTFPRVYPDPLLGLHYGQALMGGDGMIVAVVSVRGGRRGGVAHGRLTCGLRVCPATSTGKQAV